MGMTATLYSLSDEHLQQLPDHPQLLGHVMQAAEPLDNLVLDPVDGFVLAPNEVAHVDLDKAWHGIHYLLTKTAWGAEFPLGFIAGGQQINDEARIYSAREVGQIAAALAPLDAQALSANFDPDNMDAIGIYPQIWTDEGQQALDYCLHYFGPMQNFIEDTAARKLGMIIFCG